MNDEQIAEPVREDVLEFYRSLTPDQRALERDLIQMAMDNQVFPETIRYGQFRDTYRGAMKSLSGEVFYFHLPPNQKFHLVKADTPGKQWEADRLLKSCTLGCDLIKAHKDDDDLEDEKKAAPAAGGTAELPPASGPEIQNVQTQDSQLTENHPGATVAQTPQQDGSSERWHGSGHLERALPPIDPTAPSNSWTTNDLMKAWGQQLMAIAPPQNVVEPRQRQFMIEVLGKTPNEVDAGYVKLTPYQRAQFNMWATKSLRTQLSPLVNWLSKSRGDE